MDTDGSILKSEEVVKKQELQSAEFGATLPKTDSSIQAYLFLVGAFAIEAILWGEYVYSLRRDWVAVHIYFLIIGHQASEAVYLNVILRHEGPRVCIAIRARFQLELISSYQDSH